MVDWMQLGGKVVAVLLAAAAGWWYGRLGVSWDRRVVWPVALTFMAFVTGSMAFGNLDAGNEFQPRVWLILGGAVLAGLAAAKLGLDLRIIPGGQEITDESTRSRNGER